MIELTAEVVGENSIATRFTSVQALLRRRLIEGMRQTLEAYNADLAGLELAGGVLKTQTGKLRGSLVSRVYDGGTRIIGTSYPKAKYGWMLGQGTPKNEVLVKPFARRFTNMDTFSVERKRSGARKGVAQMKAVQHSSGVQFVRGSRRRMLKAKVAKPFMGPAYLRSRAAIERRMKAAVEQAMAEANGGT